MSEKYSKRCQESCKNVGMQYQVWDAFDGTGDEIIIPEHSKNNPIFKMVKIQDHHMTKSELSCFLSHLSLWARCVEIDQPIVILEHDAIMVKKFENKTSYNSIVYLGCEIWAKKGSNIEDIPIYGSGGMNNLYIYKGHAYCIDPQVAKNMLSDVFKRGIWTIADRFMKADLYNITHQGLYAFENKFNDEDSTIVPREKDEYTC